MLKRLERRNREVWEGRSHVLQDLTHTVGGVGVGLLLYSATRKRSKPLGWSLVLLSTALHFYADVSKPPPTGLRQRVREKLTNG